MNYKNNFTPIHPEPQYPQISRQQTLTYYTSNTLIADVNNYPKLVYFPKNVEVVTVHGMTVSKPPLDIPRDLLCFNHYSFPLYCLKHCYHFIFTQATNNLKDIHHFQWH